ncbi:MAG: hypothetical protein VKN72_29895 [Nostocales cyanobacterium 94392]|nr:hypothetical protein [Nostocales cyanobacterium 94392]
MESFDLNYINQINNKDIEFTDTLMSTSSSFSSSSNSSKSKLKSTLDIGNIIIGNGQWTIDDETMRQSLISEVRTDIDERIDSLFTKLRDRLPFDEKKQDSAGNPFTDENPFADGKNPFGEGEFTPPPAYQGLQSTMGENFPLPSQEIVDNIKSVQDENFVVEEENLFTDNGGDSFTNYQDTNSTGENQAGNPFAGGGEGSNPFAESENGESSPSLDIVGMIAGEDLPFLNTGENEYSYSSIPNQSTAKTLRTVRDSLLRFNANLNYPGTFGSGNNTPLQTPNDLLTLFRNDMFSFNNSANSFQELLGDDNPFASGEFNPFGEGTLAEEIPFDIINVALDGLLPFNGSENVFSTPEGEIPIGNGNQDFGSENAVIGNANWNYGNLNATIGNGNWNWDGTTNNTTVGNGNWHLDFSVDNKTVGNGNWYWDSSSENTTLGNGNWYFGENNTTIGNGNWNFGNNNTIIGNGNRVYTDNSIVIGNGNWSVVIDKSAEIGDGFLGELQTIAMGIGVKKSADMLVDSVMNKMGEIFQPLTEDFEHSALNTYQEQFLDSGSVMNFISS